ncbi:MAG TPA: hypothetical protein ENH26_00055, partial [Candidatus Wolfebacteria bacterium]|nr:hypothetical protein [Candidatus Wolfebacteria bacterium]
MWNYKNLFIIFLCVVVAIFSFAYFFISKANAVGDVQFTADTIVSLSGINAGDLSIASSSQATSVSMSGSTLTVTDIPDGDSFTLKTPTSTIALKIIPSGGVLDLTFDSSNLSTGYIAQWTLTATGSVQVAHIVGVSSANTWYAIKTDGALVNSYQSDSSGEASFTYAGGWSSKVFTVEEDNTSPTSFSLTSPISVTGNNQPTFYWNASTDPDVSYYQLYIDGSLDVNSISGTSATASGNLTCGSGHNWYVRVVDNAGNYTQSSTFDLTIQCGSTGGTTATVAEETVSDVVADSETAEEEIIIAATTDDVVEETQDVVEEAVLTTVNAPSMDFARNLELSSTGADVKAIQEYLNANGFLVAESGPGSPGNETEYFGLLTKTALIKFQEAYADKILTPVGLTNGTGYFGPSTRAFINYGSLTPIVEEKELSVIFTRGLDIGMRGDDIRQLQQLLNTDPDTRLSDSGVGSLGNETNYFGPLTQKAVQK